MTTLWDTIKKGLIDSAKIAKEGAQIAAEKAEELGKKSKVMLEISNVKRKIEKNFTELGGKVYHLIQEEKNKDVTGQNEIKDMLKTIKSLEDDLLVKQEELKQISSTIHKVEEPESEKSGS